ncbi:MAG: thioredoxin-disulfide reductase [Candidatus Bathyarchaeia archaeon]
MNLGTNLEDLIIIGSGCAGCAAAIYASRAGLEPLVIEGPQPGGQLMMAGEVENFPGFPDPVPGPTLVERMRQQAERLGARFLSGSVTRADFSKRPLKVLTESGVHEARSFIIATGSRSKWLGLESERRLIGRGVSSCAYCDGYFFKGKRVAVVGGGDTALGEALFLSGIAKEVVVVHRRSELRAKKTLQDRAFRNEKIRFEWNKIVSEVLGSDRVSGILLKDVITGEVKRLDCDGLFVAIGHEPNTEAFKGQLEMDEEGYIMTKDLVKTSVEGVFAAGDVCNKRYRQAVVASALGSIAAIEAEKFLEGGKG